MLFFLIIFFLMAFSEWRLISSDFYQEQIDTTSNWETLKSCTNDLTNTHSINQCQTNRLDFIRLREDAERIKKEFNYPHFQLRIITDVIYIRSKYGEESHFNIQIKDSTQVTKLFTRQYQESSLQEYDNVCRQRCSGNCGSLNEDKIEIMTHIINAIDHNNPLFNIQYCFQPQNQYMHIGLRNILIYVNSCHISCASCSGNTKNDFLTCYYGSQEGGSCQCEESNKYIHLLKGCVFECPRDYYLADESNYCQFDKRIKSKFIYFPHSQIDNANLIPYDPWIYVPDPFHINNSNKIFSCQGEDQVGKFSYYESMKLRLPQHEGLNYLRIRVSFYFFGWQTDSVLSVIVDKYSQMRIEKTLNNYTVYNGRLNKFESSSCSGEEYDYLRIETVLKTYTTTPVIQFQAIQKQYNEYWSFKNVTIDYGLCQSNCTKCKSFSKCLICESNYKLYRGSCVLQCPMYSQVNNDECIDYEDLIDNSRYLIKAFYDMNTTFEEVSKVVDNFTDLNDIIQQSFTGAFYSFVPEKSVLGGVLVWSKGKFKKTFTSLKPHYKVSIRMNITYGDNNNGWFQLKLDSQEQNKIYNPKTGTKNLVGDQKDETTILIDTHLLHSSDQLDIVLSANTNEPQLDEAFIYISEYFVVVHYCVPFCTSCTGPLIDDCTSSYSGQNSINYCSINEYLEFNSDTQIYICKQCNQLGCIECQSASVCKRCEFSDQKQFYLDQGECICYPSAYLQSNECINQCYTCNSDFHRSVNNYQCQCVIGYYDDGYNLECLPLCGDELIVEGEDCDDGKNNPFDGCDHCRFKCQDECLNCHQGKCYQCKDGYTYDQTTYKCLTTCGDKIIQGNEQCDDGNDNIQDGCHYCKLICDINCINCINGNCLKCDEINGWYLNNFNHCQYICGDGIITKQYKQCDDSNQYPFDLCDNCNLSCSDHCISCENGICQNCETGFIYHNQIKKCLSICGDSIIVGNEQCEDSSSDIMNSCQYCNFKCNSKCLLCDFNECLQCELGYYLRNNMCEESCGDGLIVSNEQCDDLIQSIDSNCLSCRYNCGYGCIICTNGICELCEFGYIREQYRCKPICGDQIIVYPEVCDDANLEPYDGCHFCQYSCIPQCLKCILGVCSEMQQLIIDEQYQVDNKYNCSDYCTQCQDQNICLMCEQYFQLSNSFCIPICGDGIIIPGLEQCEDGNDIPFDGCYQCQYQCSYGCIECEQFNQCIKCDDDQFILDIQTNKCLINHKLNNIIETDNSILFIDQITQIRCNVNQILIDNICINQCGNGILNTEYEICDDGNYQGGDGCSYTCTIEDSYQCQNKVGLLSQCTYIQPPNFFLKVLSNSINSTQIVELTFSQQIKLQTYTLFEDLAIYNITPPSNYKLIINPIQNLSTSLNYPIYQIIITFIEPVQNPIFQIELAKSIILNEFDLNLQKYQMTINLGNPFVLTESTQAKLGSVVKMNEAIMYSLVGISILATVTGNTIIFVNLLELLQSLSYLRYMQYQFPPHLIEFLNTYSKVSLQPILDHFKINELFMKLNGGTLPFQDQNKQKQDQSNALNQFFLLNAKSCYFSTIASIFIYFTCCIISSNRLNKIIFIFYQKYEENGRFLKLIILFQKKVQLLTFKLKNEYFSIGIFNVYQAILHQYCFSSLLQFPYYQFDTPLQIFNSLNAIFSLLFISITSLQLLSITSSNIKDKQRWKYFYNDSKMQFWAVNCKPFFIYRILFYILIIVKFIEYPEVQSILLSMQSFYYLIYLIKYKPLKSSCELNKLKYREFLFLLITGSLLIYSFKLSYDSYMLFGWIHIGMISLMLIINLIIDLYNQIITAKDNYRRKQQKQKLKELQKYYNNSLQRFVLQ